MTTDTELLRRYIEERSEPAFTELVQRHIGLVYSVALRRVGGDAHLAEDVAQKVFCDLARKAASLTGRATISGWLYAGAHFASAAVVRGERRRKAREIEAHTMHTTLSPSESDADWAQLRPVIDDAIVALKEVEREAITLRFFEQRSFAEVGATLRVTEEAARKRVDRALDKLRGALARRGVTSTAAALGVALTAIGAVTAPAGLTAKVAGHALANAPGAASLLHAVGAAIWPAAAALIVGAVLISSQSAANDSLRAELEQLTVENAALARLRAENGNLRRTIAQADELIRIQPVPAVTAPPPTIEAPSAPRRIAARINVSPQGTLEWNREPVKLFDFIARLKALQATIDPEARIHIRGVGAEFPALAYVIDEVRKAGLNHVTIESTARPDPKFGWSWF